MPAEQTVIGIDPGSRVSGIGVVQKNRRELICLYSGCIRLDGKSGIHERLAVFYDELNALIRQFEPKIMVVESLFTSKNIQSILKLAQVRGVALLAGQQNHLTIVEYSPATIKQTITGYGRATKEQIQYMTARILKLKELPKPKDAADALAMSICYFHRSRLEERLRSYR